MYHTSIGLTVYILVIAFILGTVLGSFIDCMAWRIVKQESVLRGRSHCDVCGHQLSAKDLIPIFSYLASGGKCNYCGASISAESTWIEIILGVVFALIVYRFDVSFMALRYMGLAVVLAGLSLVDLKTFIIPDRFHVMGTLWWLIILPLIAFTKGIGVTAVLSIIPDAMSPVSAVQEMASQPAASIMVTDLKYGFMSAFGIAAFMLVVSLIFDRISGKESLGGGDIKLLFMTGLYMRPWTTLFNLIISCFVGLFFVLILKKDKIPFGPSISIATMISIFVGDAFVAWYIGLLM